MNLEEQLQEIWMKALEGDCIPIDEWRDYCAADDIMIARYATNLSPKIKKALLKTLKLIEECDEALLLTSPCLYVRYYRECLKLDPEALYNMTAPRIREKWVLNSTGTPPPLSDKEKFINKLARRYNYQSPHYFEEDDS